MIRYVPGTIPGLEGIQQIAILDGDTHIGRWIEESGRLDHDQNALPRILPLIAEDAMVLDVGSFIGDHSAAYAAKARNGSVLAIEAALDAFECLEANTSKLGNVLLMLSAIGDGEKTAQWGFDEPNKGARALKRLSTPSIYSFRTFRIDDLGVATDFIKLDIEGWEVRALRGAEQTIKRCRPTIVCEVNAGALLRTGTSAAELHALLTSYGYEMRDLFTDEKWAPNDERPQFDVVARFVG